MMILQLIKEEDVAEVLEIYTSYILNTAITYEYEVPVLESFSERVSHYTCLLYTSTGQSIRIFPGHRSYKA